MEGEERGTRRRADGALAMVGISLSGPSEMKGGAALARPRRSPSTDASFSPLGAKGWKGLGEGRRLLEHGGGAGRSDVLQEVRPHPATLSSLPALHFTRLGTNESVTRPPGQAGGGEGGRSAPQLGSHPETSRGSSPFPL